MSVVDRDRHDAPGSRPQEPHPELELRGWYDPDAASYVELVERVLAIQRRRAAGSPVSADEEATASDRV